MNRAAHLAALLALASSTACAPPATELVLVVDSNLDVPTELDEVVVVITGPTETREVSQSLVEDGAPTLPVTLGIASNDPAVFGPFTIVARGRERGSDILETEVTTTLVANTTTTLTMLLVRGCVGRPRCVSGQTCSVDGCQRASIEPGDLEEWTGEAPPPFTSSDPCVENRWDLDSDGFGDAACEGGTDCDDDVMATNPGVPEVCDDGVDNDCDERIDEGDCP